MRLRWCYSYDGHLTNPLILFRWLFVTEEDIKSLPGFQVCLPLSIDYTYVDSQDFLVYLYLNSLSLYCLQNQTLIAVKAPHGTTLEVPDPDEVSLSLNDFGRHLLFTIRCQNLMIIRFFTT